MVACALGSGDRRRYPVRTKTIAAFTEDEIREHFFIWQMFRDGAVAVVHDTPVFDKLTIDLNERGYLVHKIDCRFEDPRDLEHELRRQLNLRADIGRDAFNSQMWDIEFPDCKGMVIALTSFDEFYARFPKYSWDIIDILANHCRIRMLFGERLLIMLHSTDRNIKVEPVGAVELQQCFMRNCPADLNPNAEGTE